MWGWLKLVDVQGGEWGVGTCWWRWWGSVDARGGSGRLVEDGGRSGGSAAREKDGGLIEAREVGWMDGSGRIE